MPALTNGKTQFYADVIAGRPALWEIAAGVAFCCTRQECLGWGMALQVDWHSLRPLQLSEALKRRFDNAERYTGYYLFLDSRQAFVVWHCLHEILDSDVLDEIGTYQLQLVGLEHLNLVCPGLSGH